MWNWPYHPKFVTIVSPFVYSRLDAGCTINSTACFQIVVWSICTSEDHSVPHFMAAHCYVGCNLETYIQILYILE